MLCKLFFEMLKKNNKFGKDIQIYRKIKYKCKKYTIIFKENKNIQKIC